MPPAPSPPPQASMREAQAQRPLSLPGGKASVLAAFKNEKASITMGLGMHGAGIPDGASIGGRGFLFPPSSPPPLVLRNALGRNAPVRDESNGQTQRQLNKSASFSSPSNEYTPISSLRSTSPSKPPITIPNSTTSSKAIVDSATQAHDKGAGIDPEREIRSKKSSISGKKKKSKGELGGGRGEDQVLGAQDAAGVDKGKEGAKGVVTGAVAASDKVPDPKTDNDPGRSAKAERMENKASTEIRQVEVVGPTATISKANKKPSSGSLKSPEATLSNTASSIPINTGSTKPAKSRTKGASEDPPDNRKVSIAITTRNLFEPLVNDPATSEGGKSRARKASAKARKAANKAVGIQVEVEEKVEGETGGHAQEKAKQGKSKGDQQVNSISFPSPGEEGLRESAESFNKSNLTPPLTPHRPPNRPIRARHITQYPHYQQSHGQANAVALDTPAMQNGDKSFDQSERSESTPFIIQDSSSPAPYEQDGWQTTPTKAGGGAPRGPMHHRSQSSLKMHDSVHAPPRKQLSQIFAPHVRDSSRWPREGVREESPKRSRDPNTGKERWLYEEPRERPDYDSSLFVAGLPITSNIMEGTYRFAIQEHFRFFDDNANVKLIRDAGQTGMFANAYVMLQTPEAADKVIYNPKAAVFRIPASWKVVEPGPKQSFHKLTTADLRIEKAHGHRTLWIKITGRRNPSPEQEMSDRCLPRASRPVPKSVQIETFLEYFGDDHHGIPKFRVKPRICLEKSCIRLEDQSREREKRINVNGGCQELYGPPVSPVLMRAPNDEVESLRNLVKAFGAVDTFGISFHPSDGKGYQVMFADREIALRACLQLRLLDGMVVQWSHEMGFNPEKPKQNEDPNRSGFTRVEIRAGSRDDDPAQCTATSPSQTMQHAPGLALGHIRSHHVSDGTRLAKPAKDLEKEYPALLSSSLKARPSDSSTPAQLVFPAGAPCDIAVLPSSQSKDRHSAAQGSAVMGTRRPQQLAHSPKEGGEEAPAPEKDTAADPAFSEKVPPKTKVTIPPPPGRMSPSGSQARTTIRVSGIDRTRETEADIRERFRVYGRTTNVQWERNQTDETDVADATVMVCFSSLEATLRAMDKENGVERHGRIQVVRLCGPVEHGSNAPEVGLARANSPEDTEAAEVPEGARLCTPEPLSLPPGVHDAVPTVTPVQLTRADVRRLSERGRSNRSRSLSDPVGGLQSAPRGLAIRISQSKVAPHNANADILPVTPPISLNYEDVHRVMPTNAVTPEEVATTTGSKENPSLLPDGPGLALPNAGVETKEPAVLNVPVPETASVSVDSDARIKALIYQVIAEGPQLQHGIMPFPGGSEFSRSLRNAVDADSAIKLSDVPTPGGIGSSLQIASFIMKMPLSGLVQQSRDVAAGAMDASTSTTEQRLGATAKLGGEGSIEAIATERPSSVVVQAVPSSPQVERNLSACRPVPLVYSSVLQAQAAPVAPVFGSLPLDFQNEDALRAYISGLLTHVQNGGVVDHSAILRSSTKALKHPRRDIVTDGSSSMPPLPRSPDLEAVYRSPPRRMTSIPSLLGSQDEPSPVGIGMAAVDFSAQQIDRKLAGRDTQRTDSPARSLSGLSTFSGELRGIPFPSYPNIGAQKPPPQMDVPAMWLSARGQFGQLDGMPSHRLNPASSPYMPTQPQWVPPHTPSPSIESIAQSFSHLNNVQHMEQFAAQASMGHFRRFSRHQTRRDSMQSQTPGEQDLATPPYMPPHTAQTMTGFDSLGQQPLYQSDSFHPGPAVPPRLHYPHSLKARSNPSLGTSSLNHGQSLAQSMTHGFHAQRLGMAPPGGMQHHVGYNKTGPNMSELGTPNRYDGFRGHQQR